MQWSGRASLASQLGEVGDFIFQKHTLPIFFALTSMEFTVLNLADIRLVSIRSGLFA